MEKNTKYLSGLYYKYMALLWVFIAPVFISAQVMQVANGFYENKGQFVDQNGKQASMVKYVLYSPGCNVQLRQTGFSYDTYTEEATNNESEQPLCKFKEEKRQQCTRHFHRVDIDLLGCNSNAVVSATGQSESSFNYCTSDAPGGVQQVHYYSHVLYKEIYPHIDLEFFTTTSSGMNNVPAEYRFIVHTGGNPADIKLAYHGANHVALNNNKVTVSVAAGNFTESIPASYIEETGKTVRVFYKKLSRNGNNVTIGFSPERNNNNTGSLIIDPAPCLGWATYYGGTSDDEAYGVALDAAGNVYTTGYTNSSTAIATAGSYQSTIAGNFDAFVAKFNSLGTTLLWGTYYGGTGNDWSYGITLDKNDNVYITGYTSSSNGIATLGAYQANLYGVYDAFVAKFNSSGSLLWGTYFGGNGNDEGSAIVVDSSRNVYVTGFTNSSKGIATASAFKLVGDSDFGDAFIAKFNPAGTGLTWATYYGGGKYEWGYGIAIDADRNVYTTGYTASAFGIATIGSYQKKFGGVDDAYVSKLDSSGSKLIWGTYYGGSDYDYGEAIAIDSGNNVYITGISKSDSAIATLGAYQTNNGGGNYDAFVAKFNSTGTNLLWGTYYGGNQTDEGYGITLDAMRNVYIAGFTQSPNGIATAGAYKSICDTLNGDAFVAEFDSSGTALLWGTYYGGTTDDFGHGIAVDSAGDTYITGYTASSNSISTGGEYQTSFGGAYDAFVAKFGCDLTNVNTVKNPEKGLIAYPNPFSQYVKVQLNNDATVTLFNEMGQSMGYWQMNKGVHDINTAAIAPGVYLLQVRSNNGIEYKKLVKVN